MPTITMRSTTTHEVEIPGTDITFEPVGPIPESHEDIWFEALTDDKDGDAFRVAWLVHDEWGYESWEWDNPSTDPTEWVDGCFRDFRNSHDGGGQEARDDFYREMVEAVGEDHVFVVEVYSHGLESYSVVGAKWYPDRQWDVAPACVLAVPPDATNPREWADGMMESWTAIANGDCWTVITHYVQPDGTVSADDAIGGMIGRGYAEEAAKSGVY